MPSGGINNSNQKVSIYNASRQEDSTQKPQKPQKLQWQQIYLNNSSDLTLKSGSPKVTATATVNQVDIQAISKQQHTVSHAPQYSAVVINNDAEDKSLDTLLSHMIIQNNENIYYITNLEDFFNYHLIIDSKIIENSSTNDNFIQLPGKLYENTASPINIVIDFRKIRYDDIVKYNSLFDETPTLFSNSLTANLKITSIIDSKLLSDEGGPGLDFSRRIFATKNQISIQDIQSATDSYHLQNRLIKVDIDIATNENKLVIEFKGKTWQHQLFGYIHLDTNGNACYHQGKLNQLKPGQKICLKDAPWHDKNFNIQMNRLIKNGFYIANGDKHQIPQDIKFSYSTTTAAEIKSLQQQFVWNTISDTEALSQPRSIQIINDLLFDSCMADLTLQDNKFIKNDVLKDWLGDAQVLRVTTKLTSYQWHDLLVRLKAIDKTGITIIQDHLNDQPNDWQFPNNITDEYNLTTENIDIVLDKRSYVPGILPADNKNTHICQASIDSQSNQLLYDLCDNSSTGFNSFEFIPTKLMVALEKGTPIKMYLGNNLSLYHELESLLSNPPCLIIYGKLIEFPNAKISFHVSTSFKPVTNLWSRYLAKATEQSKKSFEQIKRELATKYAEKISVQLSNEMACRVSIFLEALNKYAKKPINVDDQVFDKIWLSALSMQRLDGTDAISAMHFKKACDSSIIKIYREDTELYRYAKYLSANVFRAKTTKEIDTFRLKAWLEQQLQQNEIINEKLIKKNIWLLSQFIPYDNLANNSNLESTASTDKQLDITQVRREVDNAVDITQPNQNVDNIADIKDVSNTSKFFTIITKILKFIAYIPYYLIVCPLKLAYNGVLFIINSFTRAKNSENLPETNNQENILITNHQENTAINNTNFEVEDTTNREVIKSSLKTSDFDDKDILSSKEMDFIKAILITVAADEDKEYLQKCFNITDEQIQQQQQDLTNYTNNDYEVEKILRDECYRVNNKLLTEDTKKLIAQIGYQQLCHQISIEITKKRTELLSNPENKQQIADQIDECLKQILPEGIYDYKRSLVSDQILQDDVSDLHEDLWITREKRRIIRLAQRVNWSPITLIKSVSGTGKSELVKQVANSLNAQSVVFNVKPGITLEQAYGRNQTTYKDGKRETVFVPGPIYKWLHSKANDKKKILQLDESTIAPEELWDFLFGMKEEDQPYVTIHGKIIPVSKEHHRAIMTSNFDDISTGRIPNLLLESIAIVSHHKPLPEGFKKHKIIKPQVRNFVETIKFTDDPDIKNNAINKITECLDKLYIEYAKKLPSYHFTPRDLYECCSRMESYFIDYIDNKTTETKLELSLEMIYAVARAAMHDTVAGSIDIDSDLQPKLKAIDCWHKNYFPGNDIIVKQHEQAFESFYNHLQIYVSQQTNIYKNYDITNNSTINLINIIWKDLQRVKLEFKTNKPHRGKHATIIEGPPGLGKDTAIALTVKYWQHVNDNNLDYNTVTASENSLDAIEKLANTAYFEGGFLNLPEINILETSTTEGILNELLSSIPKKAGFHLFLTINNNALAGRNQFSPALINRLTRYTLGGYAYDDLVKILNQQLNVKQYAELIITHHWNLRNKLKEAGIRAEPTIADLKHIATEINKLKQPTSRQVIGIVKNNYDKYTQLLSWNVKQKNSFFTQQTITDTVITQANVCTDLIDLVNKEFYNKLPAITVIKGLKTEFISAENTITVSSIDQEAPIEQQLQIIKELLNKHLVATFSIRKLKDLLTPEITNMLDELNIVADNSPKNVELTKHITEVMLDLYSQYKENITPNINLIESINEMQLLLATSVNTESTVEETKVAINSIVRKIMLDAVMQQLATENKEEQFIAEFAEINDKNKYKFPGNDALINQKAEKIASIISKIVEECEPCINDSELQQKILDEFAKSKDLVDEVSTMPNTSLDQNITEVALARVVDNTRQKFENLDPEKLEKIAEKIVSSSLVNTIVDKFKDNTGDPELQQKIRKELKKYKDDFNKQVATKQSSIFQKVKEYVKVKAQEKILDVVVNKIIQAIEQSDPEELVNTIEKIVKSSFARKITATEGVSSFVSNMVSRVNSKSLAREIIGQINTSPLVSRVIDKLGINSFVTKLDNISSENYSDIMKVFKGSYPHIYYPKTKQTKILPILSGMVVRADITNHIRSFFGLKPLDDAKVILLNATEIAECLEWVDSLKDSFIYTLSRCPNFCFPNSTNKRQAAKELIEELSIPLVQKNLDGLVKKYHKHGITKQLFNKLLESLAIENEAVKLNTEDKSELAITNKMRLFLMLLTELRTPASDLLCSIAFSTSYTKDASICFIEIITRGNIRTTGVVNLIESSNNLFITVVDRIDIISKACKNLLEDELTDKQIINLIDIIEQLVTKDGHYFALSILASLEKLTSLTGRLKTVANTANRLLMQQYKPLVENIIPVASRQLQTHSDLSIEEQLPLEARELLITIANRICDKLIISGRNIIKEYSDTPRPTIDIQRAIQGQSPFVSQAVVDSGFQKTVIASMPQLDSLQLSALFFNKKTGEVINILDEYIDEENKVLDKFLTVKNGFANSHSNVMLSKLALKDLSMSLLHNVTDILIFNDFNHEFMMRKEINSAGTIVHMPMEPMIPYLVKYKRKRLDERERLERIEKLFLKENTDMVYLDGNVVYQFILSTMLKRVGELRFLSVLNHSSQVGMSRVQDESQLQQLIDYTHSILGDNPLLYPPAKPFTYNTEAFRRNEKSRIKQALGEAKTNVIHPDDIIKAFREIIKK